MSAVSDVSVIDQVATSLKGLASVPASPLGHIGTQAPDSSVGSSALLVEKPVTGLLVLRADSAKTALSTALQKAVSLSLPERLSSVEASSHCVRWMTPNEWLLSGPLEEAYELEQSLRSQIDGPIAIVNVSGGYTLLELKGSDAINILKKSTGYDVDPAHFPPGKVVNTTFSKAQVTLRALPDQAYELLVRRSFADYVCLWIQRAGKEYGLEVSHSQG